MFMTGSSFLLGNWNPENGLKLEWSEGHKWFVKLPISKFGEQSFDFKFVIKNNNCDYTKWESGSNHQFNFDHFFTIMKSRDVS